MNKPIASDNPTIDLAPPTRKARSDVASRLLAWHAEHGRHDLPWQNPRTPYRVWISEIMLQQTQVTTVIPYFMAFMQRFPDVGSLAAASQDEVLSHWAGLGYYARGRNLHKAATDVEMRFSGQLPSDLEDLQSLPGIGRSTAGAIRAMGFGLRAPILDGNVKRVLCRHEAITEWSGNPSVTRHLWALAEDYTPHAQLSDYTQAIMDLGATLCTRSKPACTRCPLLQSCKAFKLGQTRDLPVAKPKRALPVRQRFIYVRLNEDQQVFLEPRPAKGIWGGLWSLPESRFEADLPEAIQVATERQWVKRAEDWSPLPGFRHTFSHYHLVLQPLIIRPNNAGDVEVETAGRWFPIHADALPALPAPIKTFLLSLAKHPSS